jgi:hypothetical protein
MTDPLKDKPTFTFTEHERLSADERAEILADPVQRAAIEERVALMMTDHKGGRLSFTLDLKTGITTPTPNLSGKSPIYNGKVRH